MSILQILPVYSSVNTTLDFWPVLGSKMPAFAQKCSQIEGQYEHFLCLSPLDGQFLDRFSEQNTPKIATKILTSRWMRIVPVFCLGTVCLLALSGCAAVQVKLGMKVYLAKTPVTSIEVSQPKGPGIGPGQKSPLVVMVTQPDGKILATEGAGHGKVLWKDLAVTASVVTINKKGVVTLPRDPRKSDGKLPHILVTVPSHPDVKAAELDIPLCYDYNFVSNFSGSSGSNGLNGSDGTDGMSGSDGSTDPNNPSPGGNGSNGSDGSNGEDGGNGGDAPAVQVQVTLRAGSQPLLQAKVTAASHHRLYLVDPRGGCANREGRRGLRRLRRERRPGRTRRVRRDWISQWKQRERRPGWPRRLGWIGGKGRQHYGNLRSASRALSGCDSPFQPERSQAGIQRGAGGAALVSSGVQSLGFSPSAYPSSRNIG
jgi:hypothetical protein